MQGGGELETWGGGFLPCSSHPSLRVVITRGRAASPSSLFWAGSPPESQTAAALAFAVGVGRWGQRGREQGVLSGRPEGLRGGTGWFSAGGNEAEWTQVGQLLPRRWPAVGQSLFLGCPALSGMTGHQPLPTMSGSCVSQWLALANNMELVFRKCLCIHLTNIYMGLLGGER